MKKATLHIITLTLSVILVTSCKKIIDEKLVSGISAGSYYTTPEGFESLINSCYNPMRTWYGQERGFTLTEYGVDTYTEGADGDYKYFNQYTATLNPSSPYLDDLWTEFYKGINTCNTAIDQAEKIPNLNGDTKIKRIAEARFLRAQYYFILVQTFGDVPMNVQPINTVITEVNRVEASRIYDEVIVPDLKYAVDNLPEVQSNYGRATKPAAEGILARVYLVLQKWAEAETLSKAVINNYNFQLSDSYGKIFDINNQRNSEVIWAVQFTKSPLLNGDGNSGHLYFLMGYDLEPGMKRDLENGRPYKRFKLTPYGNALFNNNDQRYVEGFKRTFYSNNLSNAPAGMMLGDTAVYVTNEIVPDAIKQTKRYKIYDLTTINEAGGTRFLTPVKYLDNQRSDVNVTAGSRDFFVLRIAEMYLTAAEALFRQNKLEEAASYLNVLREKRAVVGSSAAMRISASDVSLNFILDERGRELFGEMQRWFDLKRTNTLIQRVREYNTKAAANIQEYHSLRPIPQTEIDRASNLVSQNPGYQ